MGADDYIAHVGLAAELLEEAGGIRQAVPLQRYVS